MDERSFHAADKNGDGVIDREEFMEASFNMFEAVPRRADDILGTLERVVSALEKKRKGAIKFTQPLTIMVQAQADHEDGVMFEAPLEAVKTAPSTSEPEKSEGAWLESEQITLPTSLETAEEINAALRLCLHLSPDTWIAAYYQGPAADGADGVRPIKLLQGNAKGEGNVEQALDYLSKTNCVPKLYVKNRRLRPRRLQRMPRAFLEERDAIVAKHTSGVCWGLDWETHTVFEYPVPFPYQMQISPGDAVVVEVPRSAQQGSFPYTCTVYMDGTEVLSNPVDKDVEVKVNKKAKGPPPDPLIDLQFVALKEGKCVLFVEVSWEDQEEGVCAENQLLTPCPYNSVARVGPVEVEVTKNMDRSKVVPFQWWNGEKWAGKKGPAKKKKPVPR
jgi:hypothetical protein